MAARSAWVQAVLRPLLVVSSVAAGLSWAAAAEPTAIGGALPALPEKARLALSEDWSGGKIRPEVWYLPRKMWGRGNHGVTPANVRLERDTVAGREQSVLVCQANGDRYAGEVQGHGAKTRVGGVIISQGYFASGRFEVVMKIGSQQPRAEGPADPRRPKGAIPAVWTYAYRHVTVPREQRDQFVAGAPLYNPHLKTGGASANEYSSEIDFPEFGKAGQFERAGYNGYVQGREDQATWDVFPMSDGEYHTLTTEWRTHLVPMPDVTDAQVVESEGFWWVKDAAVPIKEYLGNPLKKLGKDNYARYAGERAEHWIDGKKVGENTRIVPAMAAQLHLGIWLPDWAGVADWETAMVSFASVKVWQYHDPGDVRGVLTGNLKDNFDESGKAIAPR